MERNKENKDIVRLALFNKLLEKKAFWSYSEVPYEGVEDALLIQKVLEELEMDDIRRLFSIYSSKKIKEVWIEKLAKQDPYYRGLNLMLSKVFFNIKNPEAFLLKMQTENNT